MSADDTAVGAGEEETPTWRELAVARSLDPARVRAEARVQRFLDLASEQAARRPALVEFGVAPSVRDTSQGLQLLQLLCEAQIGQRLFNDIE